MSNGGARQRLRVILGALLACAAVVLLPVEAWGTVSATPYYVTGSGFDSLGVSGSVSWNSAGNVVTYSLDRASGSTWYVAEVVCDSISLSSADAYNEWNTSNPHYVSGHTISVSGNPSNLSGTWDCGAGNYSYVRAVSGATNLTHELWGFGSYSPTVPPSCPSGAGFSNARVSYIGTDLAVRFTWTGALPSKGWKVGLPGDGTAVVSGAGQASVPPTLAGTTPGEYGVDVTTTLTGIDATTSWRIESKNSSACYISGTVDVTDGVVSTPGSGASDATGADCGLNPFCYVTAALRWAFVPSGSAATEVTTRVTDIKTHPPVNFAVAGVTGVSDLLTATGCSSGCTGSADPTGSSAASVFTAPTGEGSFDPLLRAGQCMQGEGACVNDWGPRIWTLLQWAVWVPFLLWAWKRVSASFGGRDA